MSAARRKVNSVDPIATAIIAGIVAVTAKVGEQLVVDAYKNIKELLKKKFGARSKVVKAVRELETNPESAARRDVVKEEITAVKADQDQELLQAAHALLKVIKTQPGGQQIVLTIVGNNNIAVAGDGNVINVNSPKRK